MHSLPSDRFLVETWALRAFVSQRWAFQEPKRQLPKVSVVVPSYNQVNFIERTLLSIINQNYPNLELIVIDGGSTDGTVDVLERYREHITYLHSGADAGQSDALNHGYSKATGEIFGWMNSDDLYLPGAIHAAVAAFESEPRASVVFGDVWGIGNDDQMLRIDYALDFSLRHFCYDGFHIYSQGMFWRREAHQRFGEFDTSLCYTMDYDMILRLGLNEGDGRFLRLPRPLGCFRQHGEQKTGSKNSRGQAEARSIALKYNISRKYKVSGKVLRLLYRGRRAWWYAKRGGLDFTIAKFRGH